MELRELRIFVEVVSAGGLSAAARRLHLSQSTISETVLALERHLGTTLLMRSRAGAKPTEAGERLAAGARELLRLHDQLEDEVAGRPAPASEVRLGVPLELPPQFIQGAVAVLHRTNPEVLVQAHHASTTAQWDELESGELDLALVRELRASDWYDSVVVIEEGMGVVLPATSAEVATGEPVRLDRLSGLRWSGFPRTDSPMWYDQVVAVLRAHGIHVPEPDPDERRPAIPDVKLAAVGSGTTFALAAPGFPLPEGLAWRPLARNPIVRRTWAVWHARSTRQDVAVVVAAIESTAGVS